MSVYVKLVAGMQEAGPAQELAALEEVLHADNLGPLLEGSPTLQVVM